MPNEALPIKGIHHCELVVGNAKQAAYYYRRAFGFSQLGYLGPETGHRDRASYLLGQGRVRLVLTTPLDPDNPLAEHHKLHGDGVIDIAFTVENVDEAFAAAVERGCPIAEEPHDMSDDSGRVRRAKLRTYGDTMHSLISTADYAGFFLPGFRSQRIPQPDFGLRTIDHIVGNVEDGKMDTWADFYSNIFGWEQFLSFDDKDISTEFTALRSKVMASTTSSIKFPINEPADGRRKSQIQEYIEFYKGAGVQHIALSTTDIIHTVSLLREAGVEFLQIPSSYYEAVWDRVGDIREDNKLLEELNILIDRDEKGYLLQIFTRPVEDRPTMFFEIIQRCGSDSFGKGNFKSLFEAIEREQASRGNL